MLASVVSTTFSFWYQQSDFGATRRPLFSKVTFRDYEICPKTSHKTKIIRYTTTHTDILIKYHLIGSFVRNNSFKTLQLLSNRSIKNVFANLFVFLMFWKLAISKTRRKIQPKYDQHSSSVFRIATRVRKCGNKLLLDSSSCGDVLSCKPRAITHRNYRNFVEH